MPNTLKVTEEVVTSKSLPTTPVSQSTDDGAQSHAASRVQIPVKNEGSMKVKAWNKVKDIIHTRRESLKTKGCKGTLDFTFQFDELVDVEEDDCKQASDGTNNQIIDPKTGDMNANASVDQSSLGRKTN